MKKVLFFAAALAVVSLASCGNGEKAAEEVDSTAADTLVGVENVVAAGVDSLGDTIVAAAQEVVEAVVPETK